jgi:hypothetical protein
MFITVFTKPACYIPFWMKTMYELSQLIHINYNYLYAEHLSYKNN